MTYLAGAIQFEPAFARPDLNVPRLLARVDDAARHGARLIVLPEMANIGYCFRNRAEVAPFLETVPGPLTQQIETVAARHGCFVVCGLGEIDEDTGLYYNSAVLVGPDGYLGKYRKTHFFSADAKWAVEGDLGFPVWDTPLGRLGIEVCMDATYPEVGRLLALRGAEVICFPTNWVGSVTPDHRWRSQAFENGFFWIAANRCGGERGLEFEGGSSVIAPDGSVQVVAASSDETVYGEIDLEFARSRRFATWSADHKLSDRRPDDYREMLQAPYTWSAAFYHSMYGATGLPAPRVSQLAVIQAEHSTSDRPSSVEEVRSLLPMPNPDLIVLPDLLFASDPEQSVPAEVGLSNLAPLVSVADENSCLVMGSVVEREGASLYKTAVLVDRNGPLGTQRAAHLRKDESTWATAGNDPFCTIDTIVGRIGLLTGYDACFFETFRVLATQGADLVCVSSSLPWPMSGAAGGSNRRWSYWKSKAWESCVAVAVAAYGTPGSVHESGIWIPEVREDRSREFLSTSASTECIQGEMDTHARYLREKRGLGWRHVHWYKPLVER